MPDPELLDLLRSTKTNTGKSKVNMQVVKGAAKSKEVEGPNATQLDMWPAHKPDMLYNLAMWCSDLKKVTITIIPSTYNLVPPATISIQECVAWVENATTDLLDDSMFLCDGVDELGKTKNFAHPGLCEATILFLYTGSSHCSQAAQYISEEDTINLLSSHLHNGIFLFNCVFNDLVKNGNGKSFLKFTAKECKPIYKAMLKLLNDVMDDPYHGPRLVQQLHAWAEAGWMESCKLDGIDLSKHHHLCI
ncbi:hypothetical protein EDD22DRAFT_951119 [Suillus occidentalis]|nr:hypothetical protein EDD22DRAFT_951119 [Suillus occidentalis]